MNKDINQLLTPSQARKLFLTRILKLLVLIGFVITLIPLLSSLSTNSNKETPTTWVAALPIKSILPGEVKSLTWSGGIFWVYKRTEKDIELLNSSKLSLRDQTSVNSDQPKEMNDKYRSATKSIFVFIPLESKRSCQVRLTNNVDGIKFTDPCYGSEYDAAGRVLKDKGHKDQLNLSVPEHIIENGILNVGVWLKK